MSEHLIHIGFPKTGSKFLQHWFADHPEIVFDPVGIGGCRDVYELVRQAAAPGRQAACRVTSFEGLVTPDVSAGLLRGDEEWEGRRSDDEAQQRTCATLAALFPCAWILLVTRGFRSIMLSGYSQYVRSGGTRDFQVSGAADPLLVERGRHAWNYDAVIGLYEAAFGERLIVLPFELLRDRPGAFTAEIERRLGLGHFAPAPQPLNPSLSAEGLRWYPRLTRLIRRLPVGAPLRGHRRQGPGDARRTPPAAASGDSCHGRADHRRRAGLLPGEGRAAARQPLLCALSQGISPLAAGGRICLGGVQTTGYFR
jgi:hypothetical protein